MKILFKGQSALEYVVFLAAVISAILVGSILFKSHISSSYSNLNGKLSQIVQGG